MGLISIGGFLVATMGLILSGHAAINMIRSALTTRWSSIDGQIIATKIVTSGNRGTEEKVTYQYAVGGRSYVSDRVQFGTFVKPRPTGGSKQTSREEDAADLAARYPANSQVRVYYNPAHPDQSVLNRQPNWTVWPQLAVGVIFLVLAIRGR